MANSLVVLREEFDDWAILFDPDSGKALGVNPVGVFIWKHLDGKHTVENIVEELNKNCEDVPKDAENHVQEFIKQLLDEGMAGYEVP